MKKQGVPPLVVITIAFAAFTFGLFLNRNHYSDIQVTVSEAMYTVPPQVTVPADPSDPFPININTATKEELMLLPGVGEDLAQRILDYRKAMVLFSAPEELINVKGFGTQRVEELINFITIGG